MLVLALTPTHDVNISATSIRDTAQYLCCPLCQEQYPSLARAALDQQDCITCSFSILHILQYEFMTRISYGYIYLCHGQGGTWHSTCTNTVLFPQLWFGGLSINFIILRFNLIDQINLAYIFWCSLQIVIHHWPTPILRVSGYIYRFRECNSQ